METNRDKLTFSTWNNIAQLYQDKFMNMDLYNDTYDDFCKLIKKQNAKIFEIACGPGNITKYILSKRPDFNIMAIDIAPNMIKLAKENNPTANFKIMDCREIETLADEFDGIICGFCLPYLSKEECNKLVKDCSKLLNKGGIFYFSAIEDDYNKSDFEMSSDGKHKMFIYYHEENYLRKMLKENNMELLETKRKQYPKTDTIIASHIVFICKKSD